MGHGRVGRTTATGKALALAMVRGVGTRISRAAVRSMLGKREWKIPTMHLEAMMRSSERAPISVLRFAMRRRERFPTAIPLSAGKTTNRRPISIAAAPRRSRREPGRAIVGNRA